MNVRDMLAAGAVKAFRPKPAPPSRVPDYPGKPTLDAHNCPACGEWDSYDVSSDLCRRCHGSLRLIVGAMKPVPS